MWGWATPWARHLRGLPRDLLKMGQSLRPVHQPVRAWKALQRARPRPALQTQGRERGGCLEQPARGLELEGKLRGTIHILTCTQEVWRTSVPFPWGLSPVSKGCEKPGLCIFDKSVGEKQRRPQNGENPFLLKRQAVSP